MRNTFKKMPMLLLCIAVTFSGLLAGPVSADDWNILTSAHFKIHYHSGDDNQARFVQDVLGMAYPSISEYIGYNLPLIDIYVPLTKEEYTSLTTVPGDASGGTYRFGNLHINRPTLDNRDQIVIIHEFVHAVQQQGYVAHGGREEDPPTWMREGTATYVSNKIVGSLPRLSALLAVPADRLMTLDYIVEHETTSPWNNLPEVIQLSYEESIAVFLYVESRWGEPAVQQLLQKTTELGANRKDVSSALKALRISTRQALHKGWLLV